MDISFTNILQNLRAQLNDSLIKNSFYLIANTFVGASAGFIFWLVIAKFYSVQDVGYATALISGINLIAMFSILGLDIGLIRFLSSENKKSDLINSCFSISTVLALILSVVFVIGAKNFSTEFELLFQNSAYSATFILFSILMVMITLQSYIFLGFREGKFMFLQNIIGSLRLIIVIL
ncbi:MAG: oligosaccharide flippase family protein, partial [Methanogenium sp.]|nr:oligosaccharide flippase family protein [Methanogenium sp.]